MHLIHLLPLIPLALAQDSGAPSPPSLNIFPIINYGNGCPGTMINRSDSVTEFMFATRNNADVWTLSINLPGTFRILAGDPVKKKSCLHVWRVADTTGFAMRLHRNGTFFHGRYQLGEGDSVTWSATYLIPSSNYTIGYLYQPPATNALTRITDTLHVEGPNNVPTDYDFTANRPATTIGKGESVQLRCGEAVFAVLSEIELSTKEEGSTASVQGLYQDPIGRMMSELTFDWVKCNGTSPGFNIDQHDG